jgi:hypothetical protein
MCGCACCTTACPAPPRCAAPGAHPEVAPFFYGFVVLGSFFAVNLFVGVVVDTFRHMKRVFDGSALLTKQQQQWCVPVRQGLLANGGQRSLSPAPAASHAVPFCVVRCARGGGGVCVACGARGRSNLQRLLESIKPALYLEEPASRWRAALFRAVKDRRFEPAVVAAILGNTLVLAMEHHGQSKLCVTHPNAAPSLHSTRPFLPLSAVH